MIIEFKIGNFRSIRDEQVFSLVAGGSRKDQLHQDSLIGCGDFQLVKTAAIFGANASGKSNIVRGLQCMERFVSTSATQMNLGDPIPGIVPFRLDEQTCESPSLFEITLLLNGTHYAYGFAATAQRVQAEWISARQPGGKLTPWLSRRMGAQGQEWETKGPLKKEESLLRERTRDNGLALSRGAELNIPALSELFLWFQNSLWIYDLSHPPIYLAEKTATHVREDAEFKARVSTLIKDADLGISSLDVVEESAFEIPRGASEDVTKVLDALKAAIGGDQKNHPVTTYHRINGTDKLIQFRLDQDESNGTQRFFAIAGPILEALDRGHALVLDEFECSMHPLLSRRLLELFQSPKANTKGAQLIVATHDSSLMSPSLLRRDQIWLTEKDQRGATQLFSLYDFAGRPRSNTAFERNYFTGRFGAVPRFGPTFEDMEIAKGDAKAP